MPLGVVVMMHAFAAAGAGFLTAVLWFDLMFDVQTRRQVAGALPDEVLASISGYYRRVTTDAAPMGSLVSVLMLVTLAALVAEVATGAQPRWIAWTSLGTALSAVGLAAVRTVRNAVRLGRGDGSTAIRSDLARSIYRDHVYCFAAMTAVVVLQLAACGVS